jgi:signal transduction histidine kinase/ligand-binding sensor domain-containing protein/CheY-like chemotaxis protein/HPt (histidine-containing phosphotransfer) domain-containing protein
MQFGNRQAAQRILGVLLLVCASVTANATDAPPMIFEHLATLEGLPQGTVKAALQDSQGFVWIGTEDGLVRFDGHEIHRYAYSRTVKGSLPGNFVNALAEDTKGDLWIAIKGAGLARWQRTTDTFTAYRHDPANTKSLSSDAVRTVLIDAHGRVWIGTFDAGIDILEPRSGAIRHLRHDPARANSLIDDQIQTLKQDRSGGIWVGTHAGLDHLRFDTANFAHYDGAVQHQDSLSGKQISEVFDDGSGSIWVGTFDSGLYRIDRTGRVVSAFRHDSALSSSLSSDDVRAILSDHAGDLWIGTAQGLDLLNSAGNRFIHYRHDKADATSLSDSFVMSLYQDATGLVWIGTRAGGVNRWNPRSWELGGDRPDWLDGMPVTSFADAINNRLWIGSLGGGLTQLDAATGDTIGIDTIVHRQNALGDRRVMSLHQDRHGTLWIGMMTSGLKKLTSDGRIATIPVRAGEAHSLSAAGVMTIFEAQNGLLWIGTHGGGANVLDPATGLIRQLPFGSQIPGAISSENVTSFAEDQQGNVWIGTDGGGLNLAHQDGTVFKVFNHDPNDATSLSASTVFSLATDSSGTIWVATDGGGLDRVVGSSASPAAIRFRNISHTEGLSSDTVYGVLADAAGRLWLSGNAGLMRYDPATRAIKTFHREHGLQGEEFNFGAYYRSQDGRLCFGGPGGFNIFDPSQLSGRSNPPRLALTRLEILGAPVVSATPSWMIHRIVLDYHANIVSFDFAALDFTSPNRNRLAYRIADLTDHWIDLGTQHRVTLTNLDPGDHLLEVRAANADSIWSTTPLRLAIHKNPAPWRSLWAYAAYSIATLGFIALGLRAQRRKLQRALAAQQRLESEVALRTQELCDTNRQLLEAGEAKSNFLARMSHELRTPMNGVVGMTELLARTPLSAAQSRQTQTIRSSAQTMLLILNDLLDLSKAQAGKFELESLPVDLTQLIEESTAMFCGAAEAKALELIVCPPLENRSDLLGDPLRIRQILMNLIGNAMKFTEHGEVVIKCDIAQDEAEHATVKLSVADTGIGMSASAMAKIFEPFTQADETTSRRFGGTGLGLSICHGLVELMGGSIRVESQPQVGSTFHVCLRLPINGKQAVQQPATLVAGKALILTRRPAVAESLSRYASLLGLVCVSDDRSDGSVAPQSADIVILDADSSASVVAAVRASAHRPLVIIASTAAIEGQHLDALAPSEQIVRKPVHCDALRQAIQAALGLAVSTPRDGTSSKVSSAATQAHVLIVEDEAINADVAGGYLAELGCTSVWVTNGATAIARNAIEHFDMILMDLNMPGLDGYATASLIRTGERPDSRVPIVALTANDAATQREACLKAGMDDILSKPYTLAECADLLQRWVKYELAPAAQGAPTPKQSPGLSSVDAATVIALRRIPGAGHTDLYARIVSIFQQSSVAALAQIGTALAADDLATAAAISHKIKGGAANVGALAFASLLGALEQACATGNGARAHSLYASLTAAHPQLIEQLVDFTMRASA